jgi:hypothetical protein
MPIPNVMLDLETMGVEPNAVICSIGAVKFDLDPAAKDNPILDTFYCTVDAASCKKAGLTFSQSTIDWWKTQDQKTLKQLTEGCLSLAEALQQFSAWFGSKSLPTWGCGAGFDNVIMNSAYTAIGRKRPWTPWDDRCYRTVKNLIQIKVPTRAGTYHNSLDDAKFQTMHLLAMLQS